MCNNIYHGVEVMLFSDVVADQGLITNIQSFKSLLAENYDPADKLKIEQKKLYLLQLIEQNIKSKKSLALNCVPDSIHETADLNVLTNGFKKSLFHFFVMFGLFQDAAATYLFGYALLALIPGIVDPVLIPLSIIFTVLECFLFFLTEIPLLKNALGIQHEKVELSVIIETYSDQIKKANSILLSIYPIMTKSEAEYEHTLAFIALLHKDLQDKYGLMGDNKEPIWKESLKYSVLSFGAFVNVAGSYFMANAFLAIWAASLIASPVGIAIIILTMLSGLGFYYAYAQSVSSLSRLVNPDYDKYIELKNEFSIFHEEYEEKVEQIKSMKSLILKSSEPKVEHYFEKIESDQGSSSSMTTSTRLSSSSIFNPKPTGNENLTYKLDMMLT